MTIIVKKGGTRHLIKMKNRKLMQMTVGYFPFINVRNGRTKGPAVER